MSKFASGCSIPDSNPGFPPAAIDAINQAFGALDQSIEQFRCCRVIHPVRILDLDIARGKGTEPDQLLGIGSHAAECRPVSTVHEHHDLRPTKVAGTDHSRRVSGKVHSAFVCHCHVTYRRTATGLRMKTRRSDKHAAWNARAKPLARKCAAIDIAMTNHQYSAGPGLGDPRHAACAGLA